MPPAIGKLRNKTSRVTMIQSAPKAPLELKAMKEAALRPVPRSVGLGDTVPVYHGKHGRVRCAVVGVGPAVVVIRAPSGWTMTAPREQRRKNAT